MKKRILSLIGVFSLAVGLLAGCGGASAYTPSLPTELTEDAGIFVTPVDGMTDDFIKGMDVSSILAQEASGVKYYNEAGEEEDLFKILADAGINYIRVRVWNDPYDENGNGYGGGNCDVETAAEIGRRASEYGMKLLVDFHYSDFWADPKKQMAPKEWRSMLIHEKEAAIYEFTKESLTTIMEAGADVGMVQIGNEINNGIAGEKNSTNICKMLSSASSAVREVAPDAKVVVHYTEIDSMDLVVEKADMLKEHEVDYDVFGVSYYPYWHGTMENLTAVLKMVEENYGKETCVVETSYMYTGEDGDCFGNSLAEGDAWDAYPVSVQGQATCIRDICQAAVDGGALGVFYWEGAWIPVGSDYESNVEKWEEFGSGWASSFSADYDPSDAGKYYGGCSWDNQAMFDHTGHPLASLNVWKYLQHGAKAAELEVLSVIAPNIEVECRTELVMPATVEAVYNDPTCTDPLAVTWDAEQVAAIDLNVPGKYEINGETEKGQPVIAYVKVYNENLLKNFSFEDEDVSMWNVTYMKNADVTDFQLKAADSTTGEMNFHWYDTSDQEFKVEQTITGVAAGKYTAVANIQGGDVGDNAEFYLYVIVDGVEYKSEPVTLEGWVVWKTPMIKDIEVPEGSEVTVGMYARCASGGWGTMDDFEFYSQE